MNSDNDNDEPTEGDRLTVTVDGKPLQAPPVGTTPEPTVQELLDAIPRL